jgi:threonine synthase
VLRALRETNGLAGAADEAVIRAATRELARATGVDAAPEGGCAFAVTRQFVAAGRIAADAEVVIYNTGSGASYRVAD